MKICQLGLLIILTACSAPTIETVYVTPDVPKELREPCLVPERELDGLKSVGLILADYVEGLDCANGKIASVDEILEANEKRVK